MSIKVFFGVVFRLTFYFLRNRFGNTLLFLTLHLTIFIWFLLVLTFGFKARFSFKYFLLLALLILLLWLIITRKLLSLFIFLDYRSRSIAFDLCISSSARIMFFFEQKLLCRLVGFFRDRDQLFRHSWTWYLNFLIWNSYWFWLKTNFWVN